MRLLRLFGTLAKAPKDGLGLAELKLILESPKSSLLNLLRPLVATGYLNLESGRYKLGPSIFRLAGTIMSVWNFSNAVRPFLEELAVRSRESVYLGVLDRAGKVITYVDAIDSPHSVRYSVPVGAVGEVWTRSDQNMLGYWNKPDETASVLSGDGWFRTGDAGWLDAEGFLFLHDRIKDMIVSGGENVYPAEVENALLAHPWVADAAVIGVPDDRWGETVKAVVVRAPGAPDDEDDLAADIIAATRSRLAHYKCPTSIDFVDALPRNPSGKVLKRELRAPYWEGRERNIH